MPKCVHCDGTGSLSKDVFKDLDCPHCDVALERVQLEGWLDHQGIQISAPEAWMIFSAGKAAMLEHAIQAAEDERVEETGTVGDTAYNSAIGHAVRAIRGLK